jgi:AraC-like DNA-binding protein
MHFLDALGVTVSAEISRLRIERVKRELAAPGDHTVVAIAAQSGFASTRTLNDLFLKTVGMTPLEYRNVHRPPA